MDRDGQVVGARVTASWHHQRGIELFEQKQFPAALREFSLVTAEQETSEAWNDWATAHLACGNVPEAEHGYRRALQLDGRDAVAVTNLAILLCRLGRPGEALRYLEAGAASDLRGPERQAIAHLVKKAQARVEESRLATVEQFLAATGSIPRIDPSLPPYLKESLSRRYFDSGFYVKNCLRLLRKLPEPLWHSAVEALQQSVTTSYLRGLIVGLYYHEAGDYNSALPFFRAAAYANPLDLYAQGLLIESEIAGAEAQGRRHATFSGLGEYLAGSFCERPWQHFELSSKGNVYMCCPGWLPAPIGEISQGSAFQIWNSDMAQEIRRSVMDGSFKYCSKLHCPLIAERTLRKRTPQDPGPDLLRDATTTPDAPARPFLTTKAGPQNIVLTYDRSCNLACPSCRLDFVLADKNEQEAIERIQNKLLAEGFDDAHSVVLDGAGELLVSKPSRSLLKALGRERYPNLKFNLITNGQLFNRPCFEEFDLRGRISHLRLSVDAATEATYRVVRRGGDFSRLLLNLAFIDELRQQEGESFIFRLLFVVWARNFREMADFVRLGKGFHPDSIQFSLIRNLGHFSSTQFDEMNVADPGHPDHGEFVEMLKAPELDDPMVRLGGVSRFRPQRETSSNSANGA